MTLRRGGFAATLGRFEYRDGLETEPADATLAFVKRSRIAERLVGPFEFSHVTRTSTARARVRPGRVERDGHRRRPTHGGFEVSANARSTTSGSRAGADAEAPPDRPPIVRASSTSTMRPSATSRSPNTTLTRVGRFTAVPDFNTGASSHTIGAHAMTAFDAGPGIVDVLGWAAAQTGRWGSRDHAAWAYALEAGYQLPECRRRHGSAPASIARG